MPMPKLLFVCSENIHRSRACEETFKSKPGFEAKSAGTWDSARHVLQQSDLEWADLVFVMERDQRNSIKLKFPVWWRSSSRKLEVLDIPDSYFTPEELERLKPLAEAKVMDRLRQRKLS